MADMMDRSGLILTDWAANQAQTEANRYLQVQRQQQQEQYAKAQAVETAANAARQQFAGGNAEGARQTAAAGNAWDVWGTIDTEQKAKVAAQATDIGTAAFNLGKLPKGQQRVDYFNSFVPTLRSHGMSDQEIAQYAHSGFLDNDDALNGYRDKAIGIKELYDTEQATLKGAQEHGYKMDELNAGITASTDGTLVRNGTGEVVHGAGIKPELVTWKDEQGNTHLTPYSGVQGGTPGDTTRVMNYEARGAGVGSVPDSVQTLGQFSDFASGLNKRGIKSSAAGTYQIVGATMRQYAPKVFGANWRDQSFSDPATQDRVAEAIFNDNKGSAGALRNQWVSLSPADAERIRHLPWSQAKAVIAAGESGGSVRGPSMPGQAADINLGGGRTGPLWKDETKTINGQQISGQTNQQTGEFKPLGGAGKASKPVDFDNDIASLDNTIGITNRLERHPGLSAVVGIPGITGGLLGGKVIPGTDAAGFTSLMKNFDANAYLAQVTKMRGLGALSDAEGARLSAAIGSLSTSQSEAEFKQNLNRVRSDLQLARSRLIAKRDSMRNGGGNGGGQPTRVSNAAQYNSLASGAQYYDPSGQLRRKK